MVHAYHNGIAYEIGGTFRNNGNFLYTKDVY
jgi:hypothetical protein